MIRVRSTLLAALAVSAALPASAHAEVTWSQPLSPCYVSVKQDAREVAKLEADGFAPLSPVDIAVDGVAALAVAADAQGHVSAEIAAPYQPQGERRFSISLTQRSDPANAISAFPLVTALQVGVKPAQAAPSKRVRFRGAGFTAAAPVWAHYVYHGTVRRTVRIVRRPSGACGHFSVRRRQIPITRPKTGRWIVQFDQQKTYQPTPYSNFARLAIDVRRIIPSR